MKSLIVIIGFGAVAAFVTTSIWLHYSTQLPDQAARDAKWDAARVAAIEALGPNAMNCHGMYLKYYSVRVSDLTMTQTRGIQFCQDAGLYHNWQWDGSTLTAVR
jgi:hypothetical protein